jgi:hypothetical protein
MCRLRLTQSFFAAEITALPLSRIRSALTFCNHFLDLTLRIAADSLPHGWFDLPICSIATSADENDSILGQSQDLDILAWIWLAVALSKISLDLSEEGSREISL